MDYGKKKPATLNMEKLDRGITRVAQLYLDNEEEFATPPQIALILKVTRLYPEVPDEAVGNFLLKSGTRCEFRNSKPYFHIPSLVGDKRGHTSGKKIQADREGQS